ncbi:MAG: hypothetical protein V4543_11205 [Bacteroidota bacterium]
MFRRLSAKPRVTLLSAALPLFFICLLLSGCKKEKPAGENANSETGQTAVVTEPKTDSATAAAAVINEQSSGVKAVSDSAGILADNTARVLAGMKAIDTAGVKPGKGKILLANWKRFSAKSESTWRTFSSRHLEKVSAWSKEAMPDVQAATDTLFYPFSGPDFVHAATFFPNAKVIYMFGLEPVGMQPDLSHPDSARMRGTYGAIDNSLHEILNLSFFVTKEMLKDFRSNDLHGNLTVLTLFLVRTGHTIHTMRFVQPDSSGILQTVAPANDKMASNHGVEITFSGSDGQARTLYYFSVDLADRYLVKNKAFIKYMASIPAGHTTYLKSASYLLHYDTFRRMRKTVLDKSRYVFQDDTGVPLSYFSGGKYGNWEPTFYGNYTKPIPVFKLQPEKDLAAIYAGDSLEKPAPLPFFIGYGHRKESNLQIYRRKP